MRRYTMGDNQRINWNSPYNFVIIIRPKKKQLCVAHARPTQNLGSAFFFGKVYFFPEEEPEILSNSN